MLTPPSPHCKPLCPQRPETYFLDKPNKADKGAGLLIVRLIRGSASDGNQEKTGRRRESAATTERAMKMKTENKMMAESRKLFMYDRDAATFLGSRWGGLQRRFKNDMEAVCYAAAAAIRFGAKVVVTFDGFALWRLDWLLEKRARLRLSPAQLLCNRNTGRVNRVRADGRTFKVKKCREVLCGDQFLK